MKKVACPDGKAKKLPPELPQYKENKKQKTRLIRQKIYFDGLNYKKNKKYFHSCVFFFATASTLPRSMATVIGPTPPGTGESHPATSFTDSKSISPTIPPSDSEVPASMRITPRFIISPFIYFPLPMPEIITSASLIKNSLFSVLLAMILGLILRKRKKAATGFPTRSP